MSRGFYKPPRAGSCWKVLVLSFLTFLWILFKKSQHKAHRDNMFHFFHCKESMGLSLSITEHPSKKGTKPTNSCFLSPNHRRLPRGPTASLREGPCAVGGDRAEERGGSTGVLGSGG